MPEPKQSTPRGQPPASSAIGKHSPLSEPRQGTAAPDVNALRAALREGNMAAISGMGPFARAALLTIVQSRDEELPMRIFASDAAIAIYWDGLIAHDRVLCLLLAGNLSQAACMGEDTVVPALGILKDCRESPFVRGMAAGLLFSINYPQDSLFMLSVVVALSNLLSNAQEPQVLRVRIAEEFPSLARFCDNAKIRMISSALERAANGEDSCVSSAAEDSLERMKGVL